MTKHIPNYSVEDLKKILIESTQRLIHYPRKCPERKKVLIFIDNLKKEIRKREKKHVETKKTLQQNAIMP